MSAQHDHASEQRTGLWRRLNSWWGGEDEPERQEPQGLSFNSGAQRQKPSAWPAERLRVMEDLYGPGLDAPWSDEIEGELVRDLLLTEESRVVVLGGGFGGPAARIADASKASVLSLDDRVEITDLSQNWVVENGATVKVDRRDFFETGQKPGYADAIVSFGGLSHLQDKRRLFSHLLQILRPRGRIVFLDFFVTGMDQHCPEVAIWSAMEDRPHFLHRRGPFGDMVYKIGFDYPDYRDVTDAHVAAIHATFRRSVEVMKAAGPEAVQLQPHMVAELERWRRRLALLESREVRFYRTTVEYFGRSAVV